MRALALLLGCLSILLCCRAQAVQIDQVQRQVNFVGVSGNDGEISSTLNCTAGVCSVYNELRFYGPFDAAVRLVWTRADGSVLLSGQVPYDFTFSGEPNTSIGRRSSVTYVGWFFGQPNYSRLTGTADFRGSITINPPCLNAMLVCDQDYLELKIQIPNPIPSFPPRPGDSERQVAPLSAATAGQLSTTWTFSDLLVARNSPFGTEPTLSPVLEFTSSVEQVGVDYRYSYSVTSASDEEIAFAFDQLDWAGTLEERGSSTLEIVSSLPPALVSNLGNADLGAGRAFAGRVDVLQPVPEPQAWILLAVGVGCMAVALRRRA